MIGKVLHEDYPLIGEGAMAYFRDVADHLTRIADQVELFRETIYEAAQMYNSAIMQRTNEIMRIFTVLTVLVMFPTAVSSVYSMNVEGIPFAKHPWAFWGVTLFMVLIMAGMVVYFRRRKWF
jgi:magnesium transporter